MTIVTMTEITARNVPLDSWRGLACTKIQHLEHLWTFEFGKDHRVMAECPWRIVADGAIAHADEDEGQSFGLGKLVIGSERAMTVLSGRKILAVRISEPTGDLTISFAGDAELQFWSNSSGYEAWHMMAKLGSKQIEIVAQGGGKLAVGATP